MPQCSSLLFSCELSVNSTHTHWATLANTAFIHSLTSNYVRPHHFSLPCLPPDGAICRSIEDDWLELVVVLKMTDWLTGFTRLLLPVLVPSADDDPLAAVLVVSSSSSSSSALLPNFTFHVRLSISVKRWFEIVDLNSTLFNSSPLQLYHLTFLDFFFSWRRDKWSPPPQHRLTFFWTDYTYFQLRWVSERVSECLREWVLKTAFNFFFFFFSAH